MTPGYLQYCYFLNGSTSVNTIEGGIHFELDSHADTCVVGLNTALLIADFDRPLKLEDTALVMLKAHARLSVQLWSILTVMELSIC